MRGVPRPRRARTSTASGSMATPRMPAERATMVGQLVLCVVVEPMDGAEAVAQRRADAPGAGRGADDRERLERQPQAAARSGRGRS